MPVAFNTSASHKNIIFSMDYDFSSVFCVAYSHQLLLLHAWKIFDKSAYLTDYTTIFTANFDFFQSARKNCNIIAQGFFFLLNQHQHQRILYQTKFIKFFSFIVTHVNPQKFHIERKSSKEIFFFVNFLCWRHFVPALL
jgi:hypothetical protein